MQAKTAKKKKRDNINEGEENAKESNKVFHKFTNNLQNQSEISWRKSSVKYISTKPTLTNHVLISSGASRR